MKPIIGIVARSSRENEKSIIELNEDYRLAIVKAGGIPLVITPTDELDYGKVMPRQAGRLSFPPLSQQRKPDGKHQTS